MQANSEIPRAAHVLGWLGVLPFAGLTALAIMGGPLSRASLIGALILYGIVILSFMSGVQWGLAMLAPPEAGANLGPRLGLSVLPALGAFGLWFLPASFALPGLVGLFVALLAADLATVRAGLAPAWYPALRLQLTGAVVVCLLVAAVLGGR